MYQGNLFPTQTGSPQGGAISNIYANTTRDGLEKRIQDKYHRNFRENIETHIDDGFDFLGWTFRKYNKKLIVNP